MLDQAHAVLVGISRGGVVLAFSGAKLGTILFAAAAGIAALAVACDASRRDLSSRDVFPPSLSSA